MAVASREEGIGITEALQVGHAEEGHGAAGAQNGETVKHIVFFDVETNVLGRMCRTYELLEFGAVVLDVRGLGELGSFHTLIRPTDLSCIDRRTSECNTITAATVADAPTFADVADDIYRLLHGHIWAGHNILKFDILRVNEAFSKIGQRAPQSFGVIDTYPLLRKTFGRRAGDLKLATLAGYCGYGKQEHRSIADVRMNIDVLRSCATMLFLEANYPDILLTQMQVTPCASVSEQSAILSTPCRSMTDGQAEQEVDSQFRSSDEMAEPSSVSWCSYLQSRRRPSLNTSSELSEGTLALQASRISLESEDVKESTYSTFCGDVKEGENCMSSQLMKVSSIASETKHLQEDLSTGYEQIIEKVNCTVLDANSAEMERFSKSLDCEDAQRCNRSIQQNNPVLDNLEKSDNGEEHDLSRACLSLSLTEGVHERGPSGSTISNGSVAQPSNRDPRTEFGGVPFILASCVSLPCIEVREGLNKMLYYEGFPLHLLESKVRVRFTINSSYAFDENGKPRFSILLELSESACNVINNCEDAVKAVSACKGEVEWLSSLRKESGCWAARMGIGIKWGESFSTYTTEFFRRTSNGLQRLALGHVDALTFRNMIPHGCVIDVGFGFRVFNVNNRTGVKLIAKHITLT